jgi:signal transduction histidine kinase
MKPLDGYLVAFVDYDPTTSARVETLRKAGATVRMSSPQLDLWTALGEGAFDALLMVASAGHPPASAILTALDGDPRTRNIPVLLLVDLAFAVEFLRTATSRSAMVMSSEVSDQALVRAVLAATSAERREREFEDQRRVLQDQVRFLMARADESRAEFHDAAHDLRSLLGIVFGFACNLRDEAVGPLNVEQREHVMRILEASRDATGLLERTRDSARMPRAQAATTMRPESSRAGRVQRTLVDLAAVASSVKALFEQAAETQSKKLTCRLEPISVWGDALKLKQVLTNLVVNALKYGPPGGEIGIIVRWSRPAESAGPAARKKAEILVTDTGPGIAPEFRERIFERGFRLKGHEHLPGKGLGLSIVREVVAQHGGTVRAEGQPGEGATFVVSLPCDMRVRERDFPSHP